MAERIDRTSCAPQNPTIMTTKSDRRLRGEVEQPLERHAPAVQLVTQRLPSINSETM